MVRRLPAELAAEDLFNALADFPGRVWLDSTAPKDGNGDDVLNRPSRYSFLTADPLRRVVASPHQPSPFDELSHLAKALPQNHDPSLPPFQGGIAGVLGYEAARWLEPEELSRCHLHQHDDHPTPAISMGVYDWAIAIDHLQQQSWLICQGFTAADLRPNTSAQTTPATPARRVRNANARADQIMELIDRSSDPHARRPSNTRLDSPSHHGQPADPKSTVESNFTSEKFRAAVTEIVNRIRGGDSFQVNLAQRLTARSNCDPATLYLRLRQANPAPFAGFYDGGSFQVLSSSPEGFLQIRNRHLETRPIKGTVARTGNATTDQRLADQLDASEKDRAENIMIVDLMRNDLSRVCRDESVQVSQMCKIERYQFVQHLVSVVEGDLQDGLDAVDALMACFPGGSVTGAPKIEAMKTIAELEPNPRGPYCGSMGYISCGGDADFNILIRTITATGNRLQIPVGGGITARSNPAAEEAETWDKATGMLNALPPASPRTSERHCSLSNQNAPSRAHLLQE